MGYYMRYIMTDHRAVSLQEIGDGLKEKDRRYSVLIANAGGHESGELRHSDGLFAMLEINRPGDGLFEDELDELKESAGDGEGRGKRKVLGVLKHATSILGVEVLWQGRETEETLAKIDPLWDWLRENREGMLQADGEGYYDGTGRIFSCG